MTPVSDCVQSGECVRVCVGRGSQVVVEGRCAFPPERGVELLLVLGANFEQERTVEGEEDEGEARV